MKAARKYGTIISYDLNYRPSLWKTLGGKKQAQEVNRRIAPHVNVMIGNEEDFSAALGYEIPGNDANFSHLDVDGFKQMIQHVVKDYPFDVVATTLRKANTATKNDWGAICYCDGQFYQAKDRPGSGDFRSRRRWRFLRIRPDLRLPRGADAMGGRVRRRARRAGHDHSRRHQHGDPQRSGADHEGSRCPHRALIF